MSDNVKGWNIKGEGEGHDAVGAFCSVLESQNLPKPMENRLRHAAAELAVGSIGKRVCFISSGHVREDGTGYAALSMCISAKSGDAPQAEKFKVEVDKDTGCRSHPCKEEGKFNNTLNFGGGYPPYEDNGA